jgi:hypothetical protein
LGLPLTVVVFVVSSLVAGVVAMALIAIRGKGRESWTTLKLVCYRMAAMQVCQGKDDLVEAAVSSPERRLRAIPFGAMMPLGVIGAVVWLQYT